MTAIFEVEKQQQKLRQWIDGNKIARRLTTTDHKGVGLLYIQAGAFFAIFGILESILIRLQLGSPENTLLTGAVYNQVFTMHGTTMIFLVAMPLLIGLANYIIPLMIGARDMAFPRLNALSFWFFFLGGLLLYSSFVLGGAPDAGWFAYAPLTNGQFSPSHGMDFWALGILMTGVSSTVGSINFIVTILNLRAPGMTLFKMPLFVWQMLVTSFLIIFAMPTLAVDAILVFIDRNFGAPFFLASMGGDPLLWQHMFWFFGHPEVYILILPAFGLISEVIPVFSHKPMFGYGAIVYSGIAIGFLSFSVWAHHMFLVGMNPIADMIFSLDSMIIAVPTSIKIFNWIATMWGGKINIKTPFLFAAGFIAMFIIGGLSGVSLAVVPIDFQVEDTYYIVAHLHFVVVGGTAMAIITAAYYWFPKMTGRLMDERLGAAHFWSTMVGMLITFFPMHLLGLLGMPRRIYTYQGGLGWDLWNMMSTVGMGIVVLSTLIFAWNLIISLRKGLPAGNDPWNAQTLEWSTSSPPPPYNFAVIPTVHSRRPFWDQKYPAESEVKNEPVDQGADADIARTFVSQGAISPIIISLGLMVTCYGLVYMSWAIAVGIVFMFAGIIGWVAQPNTSEAKK